jgi:hypothetical protein
MTSELRGGLKNEKPGHSNAGHLAHQTARSLRRKRMNKRFVKCLLAVAVLICAQAYAWPVNKNTVNVPVFQEDVVLQWNRVLMETILTPGQHPATIMPVRSYAMMHAAMFDAVNSIDGSHTPYLTDVPGSQNASIEAAAAQAARDVLAALYPGRVAILDAELAISLQGLEEYRVQQGIRVGQTVAARMLAARGNDGWNVTPPPYTLPATPGNWQPAPGAAAFTHYPSVVPFAITSATQFAPNPPPSITSAQYAADLNEVMEIGLLHVRQRSRTVRRNKRIRVTCGSIVAYYLTHWLLNALARTHDFRENVVRHQRGEV